MQFTKTKNKNSQSEIKLTNNGKHSTHNILKKKAKYLRMFIIRCLISLASHKISLHRLKLSCHKEKTQKTF